MLILICSLHSTEQQENITPHAVASTLQALNACVPVACASGCERS